MRDELPQKVSTWIDKTGFPLEMRVARSFRRAGFQVFPSEYYFDYDANKYREIDLVACWPGRRDSLPVQFILIVECKALRNPLLVLEGDRLVKWPENLTMRIESNGAQRFLEDHKRVDWVLELPLVNGAERPGYRLLEAFVDPTDREDRCYSALHALTKAATEELIKSGSEDIKIVFPILVTQSPLLGVRLNESLDTETVEVDKHWVIWKGTPSEPDGILVDIVPVSSLDQFTASAFHSVHELLARANTWLTRREQTRSN